MTTTRRRKARPGKRFDATFIAIFLDDVNLETTTM
jgi:hypothetical protein